MVSHVDDIIEGLPDGFVVVDKQWKITHINEAASTFCSREYSAVLGRRITELLSDVDTFEANLPLVQTEKKRIRFDAVTSAGVCLEVHAYALPGENIAIHIRDITAEKQLQRELIRLDQLNLVGQMAAGLSHEIRNPMTTVRGYLQCFAAKEKFKDYSRQFETMIDELDRVNQIITEYLSVARDKEASFTTRNLNDVLHTIYPLLQADAIMNGKEIILDLADIPTVSIEEKEIRQMILNLVRNALEAAKAGQQVRISTSHSGNNIVLSVADQGPGIPSEILSRIGTPFFTTKENGTGLGLAISYSIAKRHNAKIEINTSSAGTTFSVIFPAHKI